MFDIKQLEVILSILKNYSSFVESSRRINTNSISQNFECLFFLEIAKHTLNCFDPLKALQHKEKGGVVSTFKQAFILFHSLRKTNDIQSCTDFCTHASCTMVSDIIILKIRKIIHFFI